jgi:cytidine deaminase
MKFLLIAAAMNLQIQYPSEAICKQALAEVIQNDSSAICIPAGENQQEQTINTFLNFVNKLQSQSETTQ